MLRNFKQLSYKPVGRDTGNKVSGAYYARS